MKNNFKVDFIGVGVAKAGTSWIYYCLKEHPQICCSEPKEIDFFNKNLGFHKSGAGWNYQKGLEWYQKHFSHCQPGKIKGEFSTRYFFEREALELIKQHFPNIKIIVSLRNPTDRAFSHYLHLKSKKEYQNLFNSFEEALQKQAEFKEQGLYAKHLQDCFEIFGREKTLVLIYEDIKKDPVRFIQQVFQFLGVDSTFVPEFSKRKANVSLMRLSKINRLVQNTYQWLDYCLAGRVIIKVLKKLGIRKALFEWFVLKFKKPPQMKPQTRQQLQQFFQQDVKQLEQLLNKDLSFWGQEN